MQREIRPPYSCAETDEEDYREIFYGPDCAAKLFDLLGGKSVDQDRDNQDVIAIFHNLKGYNGMFLLQHCYKVRREVKDQITQGTKILSFKSEQVEFKN